MERSDRLEEGCRPFRVPVREWHGLGDWFASWFDWTTPNAMTFFAVLLVPVILAGFAGWRLTENRLALALGIVAYAVAALSDAFDGALARRQTRVDGGVEKTATDLAADARLPFFAQLRLRGKSTLGEKMDPARDKGMFYAALLPLGIGFLPWWLLAANVSLAFLLTAIRWPFVMRRFGFAKAAANDFGKKKMHWEVFTVCALVLPMHWPRFCTDASVVALAVATYLAGCSLREHNRNRLAALAGPRS